jgi:hypothetical protein
VFLSVAGSPVIESESVSLKRPGTWRGVQTYADAPWSNATFPSDDHMLGILHKHVYKRDHARVCFCAHEEAA